MATETFIYHRFFILVSLRNDNMDYTFINDQGWKITEYRPFSPSYAVLHTPCFETYQRSEDARYRESSVAGDDILSRMTSQQLRFDAFSADILRQLLQERVLIRDRNRSSILGRISDVSSDIYGASQLRTPDTDRQKQGLEKTKMDLERELRETDERLWKDTAELREKLVMADKRVNGTYLRSSLFSPTQLYDDYHKGQGFSGLSDKV
jgi:hypothetical protein